MDEQIASVSIGCGIDLTGVMRDLDRIDKMISQVKIHLVATTDEKALFGLNKHIDLKVSHVKQANRELQQNPITPAASTKEIDLAFEKLNKFRKAYQEVNAYVRNNPIVIGADDSNVNTLTDRVYQVPKDVKAVNSQLRSNSITPTTNATPIVDLTKTINQVNTTVERSNRNLKSNPVTPKVDTSEFDKAGRAIEIYEGRISSLRKRSIYVGVKDSIPKAVGAAADSATAAKNLSEGKPFYAAADAYKQSKTADSDQKVVVKAGGGLGTSLTTVVFDRTIGRVIELAIDEGFTRAVKFGTKYFVDTVKSQPLLKMTGIDKELAKAAKQGEREITKGREGFTGIIKEQEKKSKNLISAPIKAISAPARQTIRGFYSGIGMAYGSKFAEGSIEGLQQRTGLDLKSAGNKAVGATGYLAGIGNLELLVKSIGNIQDIENIVQPVLKKYGLGQDQRFNVNKAADAAFGSVKGGLGGVVPILDKSLDADRVQADITDTKKALAELTLALIKLDNVAGKSKNLRDLTARMAKYPSEAVIATYKQSARESARNLQSRLSEPITPVQPLPAGTRKVAFVSGGFAAAGGKSGHRVAESISPYMAEGTHVVPFENREFEVAKDAATDGFLAWATDVVQQVTKVLDKGYNPASVRMASEALAYKKANPDVGIDLIGYSAGGLIAREAQEILKELEVESNVLTMGTPNVGAFASVSERSASVFGEGDPLKYISANRLNDIEGVKGHDFKMYEADEQLKSIIKRFSEEGVTPELVAELRGLQHVTREQVTQTRISNSQAKQQAVEQSTPQTTNTQVNIPEPPPIAVDRQQLALKTRALMLAQQARSILPGFDPQAYGKAASAAATNKKQAEQALTDLAQLDLATDLSVESINTLRQTVKRLNALVARVGEAAPPTLEELSNLPAEDLQKLLGKQFTSNYEQQASQLRSQLEKLTKNDLQTIAKQSGATGYSKLNKSDLISLLSRDINKSSQLAKEQTALRQIREAEKELTRMAQSAKKAPVDQQEKLSADLRSSVLSLIDKINDALQFTQTGENRQYIGGVKGRLEQQYLRSFNVAESGVEQMRKRLEQQTQVEEREKSAIDDIGLARVIPRSRSYQPSRLKSVEAAIDKVKSLASKVKESLNEALNIEPGAGVRANLRNVAKSPVVNDLVVNTAGFAASRAAAQYGIVPELGADLTAALATRQALNAGRAVAGSYSTLKKDEVFQAANALQKFTMVVIASTQRFQSADFQKRIGEELTGDLTGFTIGNVAAIAANAVPAFAPVPFKGAAAAMATVPRFVQMRDRHLDKNSEENIDDIGLARVRPPSISNRFLAAAKSAMAGIKGVNKTFNDVQSIAQRRYEEIAKETAKLSGVNLKQENIPKLVVDNKRLKEMGVDAFYDIKKNQVIISKEIDLILREAKDLEEYSEKLKGVVHELRHSLQFEGGKLSISRIAKGRQQFGVDMTDPGSASLEAIENADQSVEAIRRQALIKNGYRMSGAEERTVRQAEIDAYQFEGNTPQIAKNVQESIGAEMQASMDETAQSIAQSMGLIESIFEQTFPGLARYTQAFGLNLKSLGGIAGEAVTAFVSFKVLQGIVGIFQRISQGAAEAARSFEKFRIILNFTAGSKEGGAEALAFVESQVDRVAGDLRVATRGYSQIAAAARETSLEGLETEQIFASLEQVAAVYQLSAAERERVYYAVQQMISKGTVSCYDGETEVLTSEGWIQWTEVNDRHLFATRNLETGEVIFVAPKHLIRQRHKGLMLKVKNGAIDLLVTPEHRMVVREQDEDNPKIVKAKDLEDKPYFYVTSIDGEEEVLVSPDETEWVEYDEYVYCATVEHTTLFVRRNGKTSWSGNSEELKQQLGEVIPGILQTSARATGQTVSELGKQLEQGQVLSAEFLPKLFQQLAAETDSGLTESLDSTQASINRFNTALDKFREGLGRPIVEVQKLGFNVFADALKQIEDKAGFVVKAFGILTAMAGIRLVQSFAALTASAYGFLVQLGLIPPAAAAAKMGLNALAGGLKTIAVNFAGFYVAITAAQIAMQLFGDASGEAGTIAEASDKNLQLLTDGLNKVGDAADRAASSLKGMKADGIIGELYEGSMNDPFTQGYRDANAQNSERLRNIPVVGGALANANDFLNKDLFEVLNEQQVNKQIEAYREAANRLVSNTQETIGKVDSFVSGQSSDAIARVKELDAAINKNQAQQRRLRVENPEDTEGLAKLREIESQLNEQRSGYTTQVETYRKSQEGQIQQLEQMLKLLEDTQAKAGTDIYQKEIADVTKQLEALKKEYGEFSKAIDDNVESFAKLSRSLEDIAANLADAREEIDRNANLSRTRLGQQELDRNITPGQSQASTDAITQQALTQTLQALNQSIAEYRSLIENSRIATDLESMGITDPESLGTNEIQKLRDRYQNAPAETTALNALEKLRAANLETAQIEQQLIETKVQAQRSIDDAGRQVADFYRNIQRQTEDLQITLEQQQFETKMQNLRNDLNRSLSGFNDVFFGDMWSALNELFDFATERSRLMTENAQREAEIQRQAIDTTRQGNEQIRTTYGGSTVPFQGVQVTSAVDASGEPGLDYVVSDGQRGAQFGALSPGEVIEVRRDDRELGTGGERGYGNTVIVRTVDQVSGEIVDMLYAHLDDIMVQVGQQVGVGSVLGTQGRTGSTTGAHVSVDFFGKDSASATSASLSMRDRIAATLVNNPDSLNQLIQSPIGQAVGGGLQTPQTSSSAPTSAVQLAPEEFYRLAALSTLEAATPQGRADVAQSVFNRLNSGSYGSTITDVLYAPGQYQPFFGASPSEITDAESAAQFLSKERGYGLEEARSIIQETTAILSDTSAMMDAAEHVGGRTDFKGVSQYGNMVPSEDRLRQQGENFFHISSSQTQSDLDRYRSMAPSAVVTAGVSATGGGSVNTAPITAATSQAQVNAQAAIASADAQLQSNLDRLAIQEEQAKRRADRQRQEGLDRIAQQNTELRRQQDETILGAFGDSEAAGVLRELRANNNQLTDATLAQQRQLRDLSDTIANTETYIDFYEQNPTAPGADQLPKLQEALTQVQSEYDTLKALVERQTSVSSQERTRILEQRQQQLLERSRASDLETLGLQNQLSIARTPEGLGRELLQSSQATNDILREYTTRSNELRKKAEELQATLDETIASGVEYSADELEAVKQEIQANLNEAVALDNQATLKVEIELENRQQVIDQFAEDLGSRARDAQAQYLQNRGDTFGANEVQRRYAMDQQSIQYQQDAAQLDAMALESGADLGQISQMRSDLEVLNQFNLDNLRMQFPDLADSINSTAFQAFQNLGTSIADVFANAKSGEDILKGLGQAFQQFASQFISSLLNMAAQAAASELFGLFFPQKGGASGGGLGSLFGTLAGGVSSLGGASFGSTDIPTGGFNLGGATGGGGGGGFNWGSLVSTGLSLIGGFNSGGPVPGTGDTDTVPAMLTPGEFVLQKDAVAAIGVSNLKAWNNIQKFNRGGVVHSVPGFNAGGYVDYANAAPSRSYRDYNAESEGRSSSSESSSGPIEVKLDTEVVNNIEYARKEEVEEAMKRAAEEGAKKGEERVRRGISKNPSYRQGMGIR